MSILTLPTRSPTKHQRVCRALGVATLALAWLALSCLGPSPLRAEDVSQPAILQMFEARWETIEDRMADIFQVGYGAMWLPPPGRADTSNLSAGYDVFDRFDLGGPRNETLFGTETSLKSLIRAAHQSSTNVYTDLLLNHNGFSDLGTFDDQGTPTTSDDVTFAESGGYPGFAITLPGDVDGDFHGAFEGGDLNGRLFGLIDIAQEKNHLFIRHPVDPANPNNIPAGTKGIFGRPPANVADANNARFYPDQGLGGVQLDVDPGPGVFLITRYDFNTAAPLQGDPVLETAEQLTIRQAQWMVQEIGVDGFRIDAAKHFPQNTLTLLDQAVFRASFQTNLDGSIKPVFSFSEILDGNTGFVQSFINKGLPNPHGIDPADFTVQGNRDALDFPLSFALRNNLSDNGFANNWHGIRNASLDNADNGLVDGSAGVLFVDSHDDQNGGAAGDGTPFLDKVAYAYTLMRPGNAIVYFNAEEFGSSELRGFPTEGTDDALGGPVAGDAVATLVGIRSTHGRGDFRERWVDDAFNPNGFSNVYIYERSNSAIVGLNSRVDGVVETRNGVQVDFAPDTILVELTGNATDPTVDPADAIPDSIKVRPGTTSSGLVDISIPGSGGHGRGYVIYGLATPQGSLSLTNVASTLGGGTPTATTNGTVRQADIDVIHSDSFDLQLSTAPVSVPDPDNAGSFVRDVDADGDKAVLKIDGGVDLNNLTGVDNTTPGSVSYGFEEFVDTNVPGYIDDGGNNIGSGAGTYGQTIDATQLAEGRHYITTRIFRHRDSGPAVFRDIKKTIYVDRLPPEAAPVSFEPFASNPLDLENRDLIVRSTDQTADNMHIFLDLPEGLTDAEVLQKALNGEQDAGQYDSDSWIFGFTASTLQNGLGVTTGNHVATIVIFEQTFDGTHGFNVQRFPGLFTDTGVGAGFGDLDADGTLEVSDLAGLGNDSFEDVLYSENADFNAAADLDGDGDVDNLDLFALGDALVGAGSAVLDAYDDVLLRRGDVNQDGQTDGDDVLHLHANFGGSSWLEDLNVDGIVDIADVETLITDLVQTSHADFDLNRVVSGGDFLKWQQGFGTSPAARFDQGDSDLGGAVDGSDLATWETLFGLQGPPAASAAAVPEPTTGALLAGATMALASARRRRILMRGREKWFAY